MAIALLEASSARIEYGDLTAFDGLSDISIAATIKITNAPVTGDRILGKWESGDTSRQAILFFMDDTDEIAFLISPTGASVLHYGKKTTGANLSSGNTYRIVAKLTAPTFGGAIYINGTSQAVAARGNNNGATVGNVTAPLFIGHEASTGTDTLDCEVSEVAIWGEYVPDWFCEAYGKGYSPTFYIRNRLFYAPLFNTSHLLDVQRAATGTNTGGTNVAHQSMRYRT